MRMRQNRRGFTLIEVAIAVAVLGIVASSLMMANARLLKSVSGDRARTIAAASADARIALVRAWPTYSTLEATYAGSEANTPKSGMTRTTTIVRTGGVNQVNDFKRITVQVSGSELSAPIRRTVTVAAP